MIFHTNHMSKLNYENQLNKCSWISEHCTVKCYCTHTITHFKHLLLQVSMAKWCRKSPTFLKSVYVLETYAKSRQIVWSTDCASDIYLDWALQQITEHFVITLSKHATRIKFFREIKLDNHIIQHLTFSLPNMFIFACLTNNGATM
jgi:hypothetical protein